MHSTLGFLMREEKSWVRPCDHASIRRSQISLVVPSEITPVRPVFLSTIHAKEYAQNGEKAPRLSEDHRAQGRRRSVWFIWFFQFILCVWLNETNQMNKTNQMNQINPSRVSRPSHTSRDASLRPDEAPTQRPNGCAGCIGQPIQPA